MSPGSRIPLGGTYMNCHLCGSPIEGARATVRFDGFESLALNGVTFEVDAKCLRFELPDRGIPLAEPDLVEVDIRDEGWVADCRECGPVAIKPERDDAHLAAARHLARVHVGAVA